MMVVRAGEHREQLIAHAKCRLAPRLDLVRFGERQTQFAGARQWAGRHDIVRRVYRNARSGGVTDRTISAIAP